MTWLGIHWGSFGNLAAYALIVAAFWLGTKRGRSQERWERQLRDQQRQQRQQRTNWER